MKEILYRNLIDTHSHLDSDEFYLDLPEVLKRAENSGVKLIVSVSEDITGAAKNLELAKKYPQIRAAAGLYPTGLSLEGLAEMEKFIRKHDVAARFGGDEFVIILPQTRLHDAEVLANRIRLHLKTHPCSTKEFDIPVQFSYGIGSSEGKRIDRWSQLVEKAKKELLLNKKKRKPHPKGVGKSRNPNVIKLPGTAAPKDKN